MYDVQHRAIFRHLSIGPLERADQAPARPTSSMGCSQLEYRSRPQEHCPEWEMCPNAFKKADQFSYVDMCRLVNVRLRLLSPSVDRLCLWQGEKCLRPFSRPWLSRTG